MYVFLHNFSYNFPCISVYIYVILHLDLVFIIVPLQMFFVLKLQ